ncbi:XI-2 [Linum grandiflorum]
MVASVNFAVGSLVWLEDPQVSWIDGQVLEINGDNLKVQCTSDKTTYTGNILIAVNPFRRLSHLYDGNLMEHYKGASFGELSPHPYAVADTAYRQMINDGISQSILVSGESGAGKTESTKMLMCYLAFMGGRAAGEGRSVEQQVLESNPVLEAFGNAKTVRNNNSSRFGKFVELQFDQRGRISGAAIRTYLLERSRVCQVSSPERSYHCFYMLCAAPPEDIKKFKVGNARSFRYLNQSECIELDGIDDPKEYIVTRKAMDVVGISAEEQDAIFRVVAAVLHLGNIVFAKGSEPDSSEPKDDDARFHLKTAAELFNCDEKGLEDSLCKRVIVTRDDVIKKVLDPVAATLNRDALAKIVYSRLFDWLVNKINNTIGQDPNSKSIIGVLDIYGFESFKTNSFEQFCINLTNEKLQQHFNQHVFKMEQEEYTKEQINWSYIEFIDNQDVLDMVEKKPCGILALLDEACMFPRSTHETFAQKLYQTFKDHKRFSKPKLARTDFTVCHYAGDVTYQTEFFLDKNKDYVVAEHQALLSQSKCSFVSGLFPPLPEESSKSSKFSSIGAQFKQQLQSLLETLNATEPHYIRCVKPNNALKPSIFENPNVLQQLRCGGVMEAIRISCAGYPTRKMFKEFIARFGILATDVSNLSGCNEVTACKRILEKVKLEGYQVGKTKVFLRAGQMAELDARRTEVLGRSATIIQKKVRSYYCRKKYVLLRRSAIEIQNVCRGEIARHRFECLRREDACIKIQKYCRRFLARKAYNSLCSSALCIQAGMRGMAARIELLFRRKKRAAILIQSQCRKYLARRYYLRLKRATIVTQCAWRRRLARRELRKLRMAAKETGALQEAKIKLEKEVEELTWRLEQEKRIRADIEEAKTQEITKLQAALKELQLQLQESKGQLIMECEAAKQVSEPVPVGEVPVTDHVPVQVVPVGEVPVTDHVSVQPVPVGEVPDTDHVPVVREVRVVDHDLVNKITAENETLKAMVSELEKKINKAEKNYDDTSCNYCAERLQQAKDAEAKITELKATVQSLEAKLVNMEAHGEASSQEAVSHSCQAIVSEPEKKLNEADKKYEDTSCSHCAERLQQAKDAEAKISELKATVKSLEEKLANMEAHGEAPSQEALSQSSDATPLENGHDGNVQKLDSDSYERLTKSQIERLHENVDVLITCVEKKVGFCQGKPVAAITIYRCLIAWSAFEAEKTNIFDRLIQTIGTAFENQDDNDQVAYWLSNTAMLLFLLQRTLKGNAGGQTSVPQQSFFERMTQGFRATATYSDVRVGKDFILVVEPKYPALLFKQQLTAYVETMYGIMRDNLKGELLPLLASCIQAPKAKGNDLGASDKSSGQTGRSSNWNSIVDNLDSVLSTMKENFVPPYLTQKVFCQTFAHINAQLFNSLLLRRECCTFSNGEFVKSGLDELEAWCVQAKEEFIGSAWNELKHTRQTVGFLVIHQKSRISYDDIANDLCPALSVQQLYRVCTLYGDDSFNTRSVSPDVISTMKTLVAGVTDHSFLLEDTSRLPFSVEEVCNSFQEKDYSEVKSPEELVEKPDFHFLCME